ncbi:nuclear transport factor 2 family protein [Micromonospora sp. NPDC049903]|uniref:nuclear transport factor 2 family protein n=1 Tax=Micromonospora sp. NPDC049903 TaxID=3364276 RepID=UPI0037886877
MTTPSTSPDREPLGRLHPVYRHLPERPGWTCRACARDWPCPAARMLLRVEYDLDRVGLSVYLAGQLFDATGDLLRLTEGAPPSPGELFDRFLAWATPQSWRQPPPRRQPQAGQQPQAGRPTQARRLPQAGRPSGLRQPSPPAGMSPVAGTSPAPSDPRSRIMDVRDAAQRWADAWATGWPAQDGERIVALQAEQGDHWASMFRPCRGRAGLRAYVEECFGEETRPAEVWFGAPRVDGDTATVEYWAITYPYDQPVTLSGCSVVRFDADGLVTESRDYSHAKEGRIPPPTELFADRQP